MAMYIIAVFLYWVALYLYVPTLPVYLQSKSDNLALVGLILSMYGLWQLLMRLPVGIAADWLGWRKPFILAGLALTALGTWMMGTAGGTGGLILGRSTVGLGATTWVPLVAVFTSLFPPGEAVRASALLTLISSVARLLAMATTGTLNTRAGFSLAFFLAAGAAGLAIFFILAAREPRRPMKRLSPGRIGRLIRRRDVLLPALLNAVGYYAEWASIFGFLPILARQMGATDMTQSTLMSAYILVFTLGNLATTAVVNRVGAQRMVYGGFVLLAAAVGLAGVAPSLSVLALSYAGVGLAFGVVTPVLMGMSIRYVADAERTTAMGLHQAVYAVGMFAGPWASGHLADRIGIRPMFGLTAIFCLALGLTGTRWLAERRAGEAVSPGH